MNYDSMIHVGGLRVKMIEDMRGNKGWEDKKRAGIVHLIPDAPDKSGSVIWYVSADVMERLQINQRITMLAPWEMFNDSAQEMPR